MRIQTLGTLSLLAGIDLYRRSHPFISRTHKSSDFIEFLKSIGQKIFHYRIQSGSSWIITPHILPKETRRFLDTIPKGRFKFAFTPETWLMVEHD